MPLDPALAGAREDGRLVDLSHYILPLYKTAETRLAYHSIATTFRLLDEKRHHGGKCQSGSVFEEHLLDPR